MSYLKYYAPQIEQLKRDLAAERANLAAEKAKVERLEKGNKVSEVS